MYEEGLRYCPNCECRRPINEFVPMANSSIYGIKGMSHICVNCLVDKVKPGDLRTVDKMCQYLDLPFDANKWITMSQTYDNLHTLIYDYCQELSNGQYADNDWFTYNKMWEKCREYNRVLEELSAIHDDLLMYLRKKWGHIDGFTLEEYIRMEEYERHTLSHYPFKDEARRDMVRKLAKLSAISDHCISMGDNKEATAVLQSYNTLMKELGISTQTSSDENTIESLSELVAYLEKTGFLLNYKINENRDIVDKTIENMQQYVRRLFTDSSETVNEMYNSKMLSQDSGTEISDEDIEMMYASANDEDKDYEDDVLNEDELEKMFQQVENEFK